MVTDQRKPTMYADQDEILMRPATTERLPRVAFYQGMRLKRGHRVGMVRTVDAAGVTVDGAITSGWPVEPEYLLTAIRDGHITVEPTVGMRIQRWTALGPEEIGAIGAVDGHRITISCKGRKLLWARAEFDEHVRSGAWAILPPEMSERQIEPRDGLRFDANAAGLTGTLRNADDTWAIEWTDGHLVSGYCRDYVAKMFRSGTWTILPPEAPAEKAPIALAFGLKLRTQAGKTETVVHVSTSKIQTIDDVGIVVTYNADRVRGLIRDGAWTVVDAIPVGSAPDSGTAQDVADSARLVAEIDKLANRVLGLEMKDAAWREATGAKAPEEAGQRLRRAEAAELLYENACVAIEDAIAGRPVPDAPLVNDRALRAAGRNPDYVVGYMTRIANRVAADRAERARLTNERDAALSIATAAESRLADAMAHGLDALPAMYPSMQAIIVRRENSVERIDRGHESSYWFVDGVRRSFREALHAAVLAVGGKLPV